MFIKIEALNRERERGKKNSIYEYTKTSYHNQHKLAIIQKERERETKKRAFCLFIANRSINNEHNFLIEDLFIV